jgi:hypothetical protein
LKEDDRLAAESRLRVALPRIEQLVAEHPHLPEYGGILAQVRHRLGTVLLLVPKGDKTDDEAAADERTSEAERLFRGALDVQSRLAGKYPQSVGYRFMLGMIAGSLVDLLVEQREFSKAQQVLEDSIASAEKLPVEKPGEPPFRGLALGHYYRQLARVMEQQGNSEGAAAANKQADEHSPKRPPYSHNSTPQSR